MHHLFIITNENNYKPCKSLQGEVGRFNKNISSDWDLSEALGRPLSLTFFEIESKSWEKVAQMKIRSFEGQGKKKKDQQAEIKARPVLRG